MKKRVNKSVKLNDIRINLVLSASLFFLPHKGTFSDSLFMKMTLRLV